MARKTKIRYLHERDGDLYVRVPYQDEAGKWKTKEKRIQRESEAHKAITEIKQQLGEYGSKIFDGERMTFDELMTEHKRANADKHEWYIRPIADYFGTRRIRSITYGDLKRFKVAREAVKKEIRVKNDRGEVKEILFEDRKPATINRELEELRCVLLYALRHGWLQRNPFMGGPALIIKSEEERRDRLPTPEEEEKILAACVEPRAHLRPMIIATRDTGLRKGALLSLTWTNVDFDKNLIYVPSGNRYKRRPKAIGMTARLRYELLSLYELSDKKLTSKIFGMVEVRKKGQKSDKKTYRQIKDFKRSYEKACELAGIDDIRFNDFRHGFATDLMEAGIPKDMAMKISGHTQSDIHDIYTNIDERIARKVADALDDLHKSRIKDNSDFSTSGQYIN